MPDPSSGDVQESQLSEVEDLFNFIMRVQDKVAPMVASRQEASGGEGRRGVIMIRGDHKWVRVFEVKDGRLIPLDNLDGVRTVVVFESLASFREVCNNLLSGRPMAFARARARGDVKVEGDFALRDAAIFNRLLTRVGQILKSYDVQLREE